MIPHEKALVKRLEDQPFVLLGVNSDNEERYREKRPAMGVTWPSFFDGGSTGGPIANRWGVSSWPTIYILDAEGKIRYKGARGEDMDFASLDVREKLGLVRLPLEAGRPRVLRFDPSLDPIVRIAFSGDRAHAAEYLHAVELLASLRLCANVPGQWAVQTALGGYQSIRELTTPGGRLFQSRQAIIDGVARSRFLSLCEPAGAMYAFPGVDTALFSDFDDQKFAMELLEKKHVLLAPGSSFNVPYRNYFRLTTLPTGRIMDTVFARMEEVLESMAEM
jgi:hypothetical protein